MSWAGLKVQSFQEAVRLRGLEDLNEKRRRKGHPNGWTAFVVGKRKERVFT